MSKLFSVICSIFVLYSAFVIELSRADLNCQLSLKGPSMISASMKDTSTKKTRAGDMFKIKIEAPKTVGSSFDLRTCYLLAQAKSGDFNNESRTFSVSMKQYDPASHTLVKFSGEGKIPASVGALDDFTIYCPINEAHIDVPKFSMQMEVLIDKDKFFQTSDSCKVIRQGRLAESVKIFSPLNSNQKFQVEIKNIAEPIVKGSDFGFGHVFTTHNITLGTYGDHKLKKPVKCLVDGQEDLAYALERNFFKDIEVVFLDTPTPKTIHVIECPVILANITSGNRGIPSIMKMIDFANKKTMTTTNTYLY